ncbi:Dihydrodipicolinate synthetase-like protein [Moelleriella libera RCEF 2490]|uniref:Dihydrodipicolinate synthetase-like protein n=1 Tax=Moelleriella libera RCEF 2490 TaxID=1081109 RepID=A0A167YT76_9HYPO|nr:Dihydrodipicolinate synthetase-like protein [Moelleriella libera RCEF 2490]
MASHKLQGIMAALITPFTEDRKFVDYAALDAHINRLIGYGVHGLVAGGSTGEFTTLTTKERKALVEQCIRSAAGRVPVIAGTGALTTDEILDLSVHAAAAGASAVLVVPPFYEKPTYKQLRELMAAVCQAIQIPVFYYHIPTASGLHLKPDQIAGLADVGVQYVKDSSGDGPALTDLLFHHQQTIVTFNGWDALTFYGLAAGAQGAIWGAVNVVPELTLQLWQAMSVNGDLSRGRELWSRIYPVCQFLESRSHYAAAVKAGMELRGWTAGPTRNPFELEDNTELVELLSTAGIRLV